MLNSTKILVTGFMIASGLIFAGCSSSVKKADIATTANPQEEISKLETDLQDASAKNIDVLARNEYMDSSKWLKEAKSDQADKEDQAVILDDLRKSRGHLEKAYKVSQSRAEKAPGLFEARTAAVQAGAARFSELKREMSSVDEDVSKKADSLAKIDTEDLTELQTRYVNLERRATVLTHLGDAQATFNGVQKDGAEKRAPQTFKKAELSLRNAESVISANVRNPGGFSAAVATAEDNTVLLKEVVATIKQNGNKLSESAALKMVAQNSQIKGLSSDLTVSNAAGAASRKSLNQKSKELNTANEHVATQRAMEAARTQFSPEEAEAYQQGPNLLIRLKQVNFESGSADLPGASIAVLAKVSDVAKTMNASEIKVEGHTDSVGTETMNKTISEKRAAAVADYFKSNGFTEVKSEGYGFQKPIATNKSKAGRTQNRRVDILITPEALTTNQ